MKIAVLTSRERCERYSDHASIPKDAELIFLGQQYTDSDVLSDAADAEYIIVDAVLPVSAPIKAEVMKAVQRKSALPVEVLNEMLVETRQRVLDTSRRVTELTMEVESENEKMSEMKAEFERIATWSEIFDSSDIATRKMICGYIIKRVNVRRDYQLSVEFNINMEQFLNGIDSLEQTTA